jgi:hypothetical protein
VKIWGCPADLSVLTTTRSPTVGWSQLAGRAATAIDLLAGARYWHQELSLKFDLTGTLDLNGVVVSRNRAIARSGDVDWVDPLVGFRVRQQLAPGQAMVFRADVGGFDAGSQFSWNVLGA